MKFHLTLLCVLAIKLMHAQTKLPAYGVFSSDEINMTTCNFDSAAGAVVLLDEAVSEFDDDYRLITSRRTRIKILDKREVEQGNIRIRFYSAEKFESIENLRGVTYTPNEPISVLDNGLVYTEQENALYSSMRFAMPNVKPGSIIEYEFVSKKEHYGGLSDWLFQRELPTVKSCYLLLLLPNSEFAYNIKKKPIYPIIIEPMPRTGRIYYEMNNIPGLKFEPFMDAPSEYMQKVEFQLSGLRGRTGGYRRINQTWRGLGYDLMTDKEFGGAIKKDLPLNDEVKAIMASPTDSARISGLYNYVRDNFQWNHIYGKYVSTSLKSVWEKRTGHSGEINLILLNLLQAADLDASPLLLAERDFGTVDTTYPFLDRFNKVGVYVATADRTYILDATQNLCPSWLIPYPVLNTTGFIVDRKHGRLINIRAESEAAYNNDIRITASLDDKGVLSGKADIVSRDYAREVRVATAKEGEAKFIKHVLAPAPEMNIAKCSFDNLNDESLPLVQHVEWNQELTADGGFVIVPYNFFTGLAKNPFTADVRFTNINFGFPYKVSMELKLQLPAKAKIDKLPQNKQVKSSDNSFNAIRKFNHDGKQLVITFEYTQRVTLVPGEFYDQIKSLYKKIAELLNEPLVITIGN